MEYMSDLLCTPMGLFLSYQGILGTSDVMLGHILSFSYRDGCSLTDLLQFSSLGREILYLLYWSCDFHRDELSVEHDIQVVIVPLSMTPH